MFYAWSRPTNKRNREQKHTQRNWGVSKTVSLYKICVHGRCGERRSPKVQPSIRPGIEPETSCLAVKSFTTCANLAHTSLTRAYMEYLSCKVLLLMILLQKMFSQVPQRRSVRKNCLCQCKVHQSSVTSYRDLLNNHSTLRIFSLVVSQDEVSPHVENPLRICIVVNYGVRLHHHQREANAQFPLKVPQN